MIWFTGNYPCNYIKCVSSWFQDYWCTHLILAEIWSNSLFLHCTILSIVFFFNQRLSHKHFHEYFRNCLRSIIANEYKLWKIIYLNGKERYEFMIDRHSYTHNLSSHEIKAWKKILAWTGFVPMTSAILVQSSTNWPIEPFGSWSYCEFIILWYP